jgi:hypothetical protein
VTESKQSEIDKNGTVDSESNEQDDIISKDKPQISFFAAEALFTIEDPLELLLEN